MLEGDITVAFAFLAGETNQYRSSKEVATRDMVMVRRHLNAQDNGVRASSCLSLAPVDEMVCRPHGVTVDLAARAGAESAASLIPAPAYVAAQFYKTGKCAGVALECPC